MAWRSFIKLLWQPQSSRCAHGFHTKMQSVLLCLTVTFVIVAQTLAEYWLIRNCHGSSRLDTVPKWTCQVGSAGPCEEGQVFSAIPADANYTWFDIRNNCPVERPEGCRDVTSEAEGDDQLLSQVKEGHGVCLWVDRSHPCRGYPTGYRFKAKDGRCYLPALFGGLGCREGQIFLAVNQTHGECTCLRQDHSVWRDGNCYKTDTKGPCQEGQWFTHNNGAVSCQPDTCRIEQQNQLRWTVEQTEVTCKSLPHMEFMFICSSLNIPVVEEAVACHEIHLLGNGQIVEKRVDCLKKTLQATSAFLLDCALDSDAVNFLRLAGVVPIRQCPSGTQLDRRGNCRRVFYFWK